MLSSGVYDHIPIRRRNACNLPTVNPFIRDLIDECKIIDADTQHRTVETAMQVYNSLHPLASEILQELIVRVSMQIAMERHSPNSEETHEALYDTGTRVKNVMNGISPGMYESTIEYLEALAREKL